MATLRLERRPRGADPAAAALRTGRATSVTLDITTAREEVLAEALEQLARGERVVDTAHGMKGFGVCDEDQPLPLIEPTQRIADGSRLLGGTQRVRRTKGRCRERQQNGNAYRGESSRHGDYLSKPRAIRLPYGAWHDISSFRD